MHVAEGLELTPHCCVALLLLCRFVVPLLPKSATGNLDDLALHSMGVLEVWAAPRPRKARQLLRTARTLHAARRRSS